MTAPHALDLRIRGIVQGVGFRPFVYRLARRHALAGWVQNGESGVQVHVEGASEALEAFARAVVAEAPPAARIAAVDAQPVASEGLPDFAIRESSGTGELSVRIAPDMPVCEACLRELFDPANRRFGYPYITCTDCGPRYSIVLGLPYDRSRTTMARWPMCARCAAEYRDPADRRFHAEPIACHACGPAYVLHDGGGVRRGDEVIAAAAALLRQGAIVAVKGLGGYHLACDAERAETVLALRRRKYRKERPFALMARDLDAARSLVTVDREVEVLLTSPARAIVLAPALRELAHVAPGNRELGVMLPYTPLHHLLFATGAPPVVVMTSANRSSEPMAYEDDEALRGLDGIADAFLVGERAIARRVDDSVVRAGAGGATILRRARGLAPQAVAAIPAARPILALGGDLKNACALAVQGQVFAGQHVGDLEHLGALTAFRATARDLCAIYGVRDDDVLAVYDAHPQYVSSEDGRRFPAGLAVQHHRAHVASAIAERGAWDTEVVAVAFDGTGYGDDGAIWGGEVFTGSVAAGLRRALHLRAAPLPGGDAAARAPVQAAAGFLAALDDLPDLRGAPFAFPERYELARALVDQNVRTFATTSIGRLIDTVAALLGFTREMTFEGQAAMWLEHLAVRASEAHPYPFPLDGDELDYRPLLAAVVADRRRGRDRTRIARAVHVALADAIVLAHRTLNPDLPLVVSGGVFQNRLLLAMLHARLGARLWCNRLVPPNDGGLCLGQAALAAFAGVAGHGCAGG